MEYGYNKKPKINLNYRVSDNNNNNDYYSKENSNKNFSSEKNPDDRRKILKKQYTSNDKLIFDPKKYVILT